nr:MAG TPA: hypothetical protein [Caudoviricetes sp.]
MEEAPRWKHRGAFLISGCAAGPAAPHRCSVRLFAWQGIFYCSKTEGS